MFERKGLTKLEQIELMKEELTEPDMLESVTSFLNNRSKRHKSAIFKTVIYLVTVATMLIILANVLITKKQGDIPNFFGFYIFSIESASMEPTLMVGDMIFSKKVKDPTNLIVGSIVTFKDTKGRIVTHRIIELKKDEFGQDGYITKGDNPINSPDKEILAPNRILAVFLNKVPLS